MKDKCMMAILVYLERKGYDIIESDSDASMITTYDAEMDEVVFVHVVIGDGELVDDEITRDEFEKYAIARFMRGDLVEAPVRMDSISIAVIENERAMVRHHTRHF